MAALWRKYRSDHSRCLFRPSEWTRIGPGHEVLTFVYRLYRFVHPRRHLFIYAIAKSFPFSSPTCHFHLFYIQSLQSIDHRTILFFFFFRYQLSTTHPYLSFHFSFCAAPLPLPPTWPYMVFVFPPALRSGRIFAFHRRIDRYRIDTRSKSCKKSCTMKKTDDY